MGVCSCSCGFETSSWKDLKGHVLVHHGDTTARWMCAVCGGSSADGNQSYDHGRYHHRFGARDMKVNVVLSDSEIHEEGDEHETSAGGEAYFGPADEASQVGSVERAVDESPGNPGIEDAQTVDIQVANLLRSEILQMASTLTGQYRVTDKALDYIFSTLTRIEQLRGTSAISADDSPPYEDFTSAYKRRKIMREEAGVVILVKVRVGSRPGRLPDGGIGDLDVYAYCIPVLKTLALLLTHTEILEAVRTSQVPNVGSNADQTAADVWEIWLGMSVDDVEFSNPIGQAKGTHKQTIGSYHLLNLPPQWRAADKAYCSYVMLTYLTRWKEQMNIYCEI